MGSGFGEGVADSGGGAKTFKKPVSAARAQQRATGAEGSASVSKAAGSPASRGGQWAPQARVDGLPETVCMDPVLARSPGMGTGDDPSW